MQLASKVAVAVASREGLAGWEDHFQGSSSHGWRVGAVARDLGASPSGPLYVSVTAQWPASLTMSTQETKAELQCFHSLASEVHWVSSAMFCWSYQQAWVSGGHGSVGSSWRPDHHSGVLGRSQNAKGSEKSNERNHINPPENGQIRQGWGPVLNHRSAHGEHAERAKAKTHRTKP